MASFTLNFNTLQQSLPFSHSLKPKLCHHHCALTPHAASFSNDSQERCPTTNNLNFNKRRQIVTEKRGSLESKVSSISYRVSESVKKKKDNQNVVDKKNKDTPLMKLKIALDMCSKRGDIMEALSLYDSARSEGLRLQQHHYTVLLYLCSSAAVGVVQPAKSGSGARTLNAQVELVNHEDNPVSDDTNEGDFSNGILVSEDVKKYALHRGFEVYESMCQSKVQMNEAALTSVARMAMAMGDGDMAFETVEQMKKFGINPRLRSYGPALSTFCNNGEIEKAFAVEKHMLEHGVCPEEPELEALLRVSIRGGKGDKVYYVLHKLRTSVRKVSSSTEQLVIDWFKSKQASRVGKRKWDISLIMEAIENNGGGWHGLGWLGKGKWEVVHTTIGSDGICKCCGVHLATIDLDPIETENFAKSVASIAIMKEKKLNFEKFQKWLDYYGPFEAVVDGANVGLFGQGRFIPSKINAVVNGIRQKLPSKKFPLIILHNRRIQGDKGGEAINRALIDRWNNADALYATPTGSNDDWYWLYAAIKFKCFIITNDEMRDHLFQLLGNDFFPKWKERHQVHFSISDTGPEFYMPPPYSVVIQESEEGNWHVPIETELSNESERRWMCITRAKSDIICKESSTTSKDFKPLQNGECAKSVTRNASAKELQHQNLVNHKEMKETPQELYKNIRDICVAPLSSDNNSILAEIEAAELTGGCTIDFQI